MKILESPKLFYFILLSLSVGFILFATPFLRYPYDIFAHLISIDDMYRGIDSSTSIQSGRLLWHSFWASIFSFFHIESIALILRAKIIFIVQLFITFFSIYYFAKVLLRNLFKDISTLQVQYLALWSLLIWISIFATHSVHYHLVWSLWYAVNYQITLPLFFYIFALSLVLIVEPTSLKIKILFILQIFLISLIILRIHPMEFLYYLMYMSLLFALYIDKVYVFTKRYYIILIPLIALCLYALQDIKLENSAIFSYLSLEKVPLLYDEILKKGHHIIGHLNRKTSAINELMYLSLGFSFIMSIHILWTKLTKKVLDIDLRIYTILLLSTLFILIPLGQFSAGLFGILARPDVVHRLYFSSSIFLFLAMFTYYFSKIVMLKFYVVHMFMLLFILSTALYSKYFNHVSHNYYKNLQSIKHSLSDNTLNFHLSQENILAIGQALHSYERNATSKTLKYYARTDIAFVLKFMYHKDVYWESRRANPNYQQQYKLDTQPNKILFKTPKDFPNYVPFF